MENNTPDWMKTQAEQSHETSSKLPEWVSQSPDFADKQNSVIPNNKMLMRVEEILPAQQENILNIQSLAKDTCEHLAMRSDAGSSIINQLENFTRALNRLSHFGNSDEDLIQPHVERIQNALELATKMLDPLSR